MVSRGFSMFSVGQNGPKLQHRSDWGDFKDNGRISESLIREFFQSKGGKRFIDQTKDLLKVMEKFDILIKIDATNSYIMPSMMPSGVFHEEESSGDSFEIAGLTNQPEGATNKSPNYDDICPVESMPMPGPTFKQQLNGDQGQQQYGLYPGPGYPYNHPYQSQPYGGHLSQLEVQRPPSHSDLKISKSEHEMNRPLPDEKMPKIRYPHRPGVNNHLALGESITNASEAYRRQSPWLDHCFKSPEQNLSEKKSPDDVPGPSVQPYPYYPQFYQGYHRLPVHPNYPYPQDDGNQYHTKRWAGSTNSHGTTQYANGTKLSLSTR
ncbi:unnamed protein product [Mytilus edulis]|uniref:Uncharacterized protein n=1 Tax=Mytilus edulis TaxID=6550 RepID=A0A8S3SW09_MYTED|nr:unnamed protein product [Mytilus edulis]